MTQNSLNDTDDVSLGGNSMQQINTTRARASGRPCFSNDAHARV
jgi:hypothetical protein